MLGDPSESFGQPHIEPDNNWDGVSQFPAENGRR
jgi:hypothetical protein